MLIGITGLYASGKDTVADYLVENKGFDHFSLSAILREEAKKRNVKPTRENLIKLGTDLKNEEGYDVLSQRAAERITGNTVITSIRHPKEVIYFKNKYPDFKLIVINTDSVIRYQRAVARRRDGDSIGTINEFISAENKERAKGGGQELDEVIKLSDININNNKNLLSLYHQIDDKLKLIKRKNDFTKKLSKN